MSWRFTAIPQDVKDSSAASHNARRPFQGAIIVGEQVEVINSWSPGLHIKEWEEKVTKLLVDKARIKVSKDMNEDEGV